MWQHCKEKLRDQHVTVIETGLIVSKCNPWLAVSPDSVLFKDDVPVGVSEIKLGTAQYNPETSEGDSNCKTPVETPLWLPAAAVLLTIIQEHSSITIETIKKILYQ
ncbi:hypothetical protein PV325_007540 [Microctonus aethiopoides]|nr:hypothetical protein PV325_007540 [Microctonus aethiopoides]